jgi:tetratricopeptide (TPR) repeat protein
VPRWKRSGDIYQQHTGGITIAHTGPGNIVLQIADSVVAVEALRSILTAGTVSAVAIGNTLPRDVVSFVGRNNELRKLLEAVERGQRPGYPVVLQVIHGMAGIGKTALAVHAARQLAPLFADGQLFVPMHAHTLGQAAVDPSDALDGLLRETGVDPRQIPDSLDQKAALWRSRLAGKHILLVLDDAASHDQIEPLVPGTDGCAVLVTSRRQLTASAGSVPMQLDILQPSEAVELFHSLSEGPGPDPGTVTELVRLAGNLPLAIQLLAGRLAHRPAWNVTDLLTELAEARDRSAAIGAVDEPISAAFGLSYNDLSDDRRHLFRRLGLHPGPIIDAYSAAALTGVDLGTARHGLDALCADHLISEPARGRYRFHDLLGDYAHALAIASPGDDDQAGLDRLLNYYLHSAAIAGRRLARQTPIITLTDDSPPEWAPDLSSREQAVSWLESERPNLHAAVDHAALNSRSRYAIGLSEAINGFMRDQGHWQEAIYLHQTALAAAQQADDRLGEANALNNLGMMQWLKNDYSAATVGLEKALTLYQNLRNRLGEANVLNNLGMVQYLMGNFPGGIASQTKALELYRLLGDQLGEANALNQLGGVQRSMGEYLSAIASESRALDLYRHLNNRTGEANALLELGSAQFQIGDFPAATATQAQTLNLYRSLGNRNGEANALIVLGMVHWLTSDYPAAANSLEQALTLYRGLGSRIGEAEALNKLGGVQQLMGDFPAAAANQNRALALFRDIGNRSGEGNALVDLGAVEELMGNYSAAAVTQNQALALFREQGNRLGEAEALNNLGSVQRLAGNHVAAAENLNQALALFRELGSRPCEAVALNNLGELLQSTSTPANALRQHQQGLSIAREIGASLEEARALEGIGRCHLKDRRLGEATDLLRQALTIYKRIGSPNAQRVEMTLRDL